MHLAHIALLTLSLAALAVEYPSQKAGDWALGEYRFRSGEVLPNLRLHYTTLGQPQKDPATGRVRNAVLILHGTGGDGAGFLARDYFHAELFGPGQPLDASRYFVILPDNIGHGKSSKPSDGLRAKFPHYGYLDMVDLQKRLLAEHLGVDHLKLVLGTSMGCMQAYVWGGEHPDFVDALMPLACQPYPITGRNLLWRLMSIDLIRNDPDYRNGDYERPLARTMQAVTDIQFLLTQNTLDLQKRGNTRADALGLFENGRQKPDRVPDANDRIYALDSSRDYDPRPTLERITARVMHINFTDDPINPPELGILPREIARVKNARYEVMQGTPETKGHGNHTNARLWKSRLAWLLGEGGGATDGQ